MAISTIIWDWNGTLINDAPMCFNLLNAMLTKHGYTPVDSLESYKEIFGFPIIDYYKRAGFDFSKHSFEELADEYIELYMPQSLECGLHTSALSTIKTLKNMGIKQIILSASKQDLLQEQVDHYNLNEYFDEILGIADIYAVSKVDIGIAWAQKNNVDKSTVLMIGDTEHDTEVANAIGVESLLCSAGHRPYESLLKTGKKVIKDLSELPNLL